jgi:hypothetical protein
LYPDEPGQIKVDASLDSLAVEPSNVVRYEPWNSRSLAPSQSF